MTSTYPPPANAPKTVLVVMGSVRPGRIYPKIAAWTIAIGKETTEFEYELIDLADWPPPMGDEPGIPALGGYSQEHTRAWSRKIAGADAAVFVTPQYNWGYPAALKNAIDHLYREWVGKPMVIVSYGGHGGGKCAAQLRQGLEAVKARPLATMPGITLSRAIIGGGPFDPERDFRADKASVQQAFAQLVTALALG